MDEIVGPAPETPLEKDEILKGGGKFWDVNGVYLCKDIVLAGRREEIDCVHCEGVYEIVLVQECRDAGMKPVDLIWVHTDKSVDPTHKKNRSKQNSRVSASFPIVLCTATSRSCEGACLDEFAEQRETIEVETLRHQPGTFPRDSLETLASNLPQRIVRSMAKTKFAD